jgi:hypothetical protein
MEKGHGGEGVTWLGHKTHKIQNTQKKRVINGGKKRKKRKSNNRLLFLVIQMYEK